MSIPVALTKALCTHDDVLAVVAQLQSSEAAVQEERSLTQALKTLPAHITLTTAEQQDADTARAAIQQKIAELTQLPVVRLRVPYIPTRSQTEELATVVKHATTPQTVITIETDATLLAGIQLETDTTRLAYTLSDAVTQVTQELAHA